MQIILTYRPGGLVKIIRGRPSLDIPRIDQISNVARIVLQQLLQVRRSPGSTSRLYSYRQDE